MVPHERYYRLLIAGTIGRAVEAGGSAAPAGGPSDWIFQAVELSGGTAWVVVPRLVGGTTARYVSSFLPSVFLLCLIQSLFHFDQ